MPQASRTLPSRRVVWAAASLAVVAILALGVFDVVALPGCTSCHDRGFFRGETAVSAHARVDCRSCHVPSDPIGRASFALRQPLHMFVPLGGGAQRDAAAVPDARCLGCHEKIRSGVVKASGISIAHEYCAVGAACSDCHSATAHGKATSWVRVYEMDRCLACHISKGKTDCDLCHVGRDPESRIDSPTFKVTHGPQWRSTHGMGDGATCTVCHAAKDCAGCHGAGVPHEADFVEVHAQSARRDDAKCGGCHEPSFCDACHGMPMPHPAKFVAGHAKDASKQPASCTRCHAASDCTTCHDKHVHPGGAVGGTVNTMGDAR